MSILQELTNEDLVRSVLDGEQAMANRQDYIDWSLRCMAYAISENDRESFELWHDRYRNSVEVIEFISNVSSDELQRELKERRRYTFLRDDSLELEKTIDRVVLRTSGDIEKHFRKVGLEIIRHS